MDAEVRTERQADAGKSIAAVILGNDAVAAIQPYAPSQLARACVAAGFDVIVPPSWGDELVAGAYLEQLADRLEYAVAPCACALVRSMLERSGANAAIGCAFAAAPPVAAARYVRAKYGDAVLITYVGDCPSASDAAIDARFSPAGFLASLHRQGISIEDQPTDTVVAEADRWRRYRSTPGGLPALRYLARPPINRVLRDGDANSLTLGLPEARSNMVVDFSTAANCVCSGAGTNVDDYEPPRSPSPIVVAPNGLDLTPTPSSPRVRPTLRTRPEPGVEPRAEAVGAQVEDGPVGSLRRRVALLAILPVIVLGTSTALGIAVYHVSKPAASTATSSQGNPTIVVDSTASTTPDSSMGYVQNRGLDSVRGARDSLVDSSLRRRRAIQIVPGWLPQGRPKFTPVDSFATRKP